ncbi:hypothetical protein SETIT_7G034200v2 [Setaria italica]|uniref:Uncharacterized protein n=2 Tax=Setaria TaxID=4554 RepID=K3YBG3_SETIT|nr:hypothetical protein SETIT_7G034200v2 [Setaria italica]TKW03408.1 hypothetical protein SEVIR_7G021200v2 [Setaria viridis]
MWPAVVNFQERRGSKEERERIEGGEEEVWRVLELSERRQVSLRLRQVHDEPLSCLSTIFLSYCSLIQCL